MTTDAILLSSEQEEGVNLCADLNVKFACVTGQAGTGKTTILLEAFNRLAGKLAVKYNLSEAVIKSDYIRLVAPTGRAAKRIQEATGIEAQTIHRLLRFSVPKDDEDFGLPAFTKFNQMPFYAILADEASMITEQIRRQLIDAMDKRCIIRFFGDINQLPPIEQENSNSTIKSPFAADLLKFPSVILNKNYRSSDGIISLADRIIKNKMPMNNDQVTIQRVVSKDTMNTILALADKIDFTSDANQIICPTNTTEYGTININKTIQQKFNKEIDKILTYKREPDGTMRVRSFKRNDKILWTFNDYDLDIMNGTLGRVIDFDTISGDIFISVDGRDVRIPASATKYNQTTGDKYTYDPRIYLDLGYAISTHKSQGSQFDTVCFVCTRSRAATRQNVYTAATRAKKKLFIINAGGSLTNALDNAVKLL